MAAEGVSLNHISRESLDVKRLAEFYKELFGFEEVESPEFGEFKVVWLRLPSSTLFLHLIQRNPSNNLPEGPWSATSSIADPSHLPRGHHLCFSVSNFQSFLHTLKKGIIGKFPSGSTSMFLGHNTSHIIRMLLYRFSPDKGITTYEKSLPNGKIKQVFFFDPDGNGLEVASKEDS